MNNWQRPLAEITPARRRFFILLAILAAILAACLMVIAKAFIEHATFRGMVVVACLVLLAPVLWIAIEAVMSAAFDTLLGKIEVHAPAWVYWLTITIVLFGSLWLLAGDFISWLING